MTRAPYTIAPQQTLADAHGLMRGHRIRHLPVLQDGKLVGIVTQRDLMVIETLPDVNPAEVPVEDAMSREVIAVTPRARLAKVASDMADRRLGSVVVMDGEVVVGMFTVTDACRALAQLVPTARPRRRRAVNSAAGVRPRTARRSR